MQTKMKSHIKTFVLASCIAFLLAIPGVVYKFNQKEIQTRTDIKKNISDKTRLLIHPVTPLQLFVK